MKVRDSWEELLDVEANWDAFLARVRLSSSQTSTIVIIAITKQPDHHSGFIVWYSITSNWDACALQGKDEIVIFTNCIVIILVLSII